MEMSDKMISHLIIPLSLLQDWDEVGNILAFSSSIVLPKTPFFSSINVFFKTEMC